MDQQHTMLLFLLGQWVNKYNVSTYKVDWLGEFYLQKKNEKKVCICPIMVGK